MSGLVEHVLAVLARPVAFVEGRVAVVGGDPHPEPQRRDPGELVLGERLGRADVERGGAALTLASAPLEDRGERGQLVGERLARTPCRWTGRRAGRCGRPRPRPPGGATARRCRAGRKAATTSGCAHVGQAAVAGVARRQHPEVSQGVVAAGSLGQAQPEQRPLPGARGAVDATVHRPLHDTRHDSSLTKPTDTPPRAAVGRPPHEALERGLIWPNGVGPVGARTRPSSGVQPWI